MTGKTGDWVVDTEQRLAALAARLAAVEAHLEAVEKAARVATPHLLKAPRG